MTADVRTLQSADPVSELRPDGSTVTAVPASVSSVTLAASNSLRRGLQIFNDSTAVLYVKHGTTASTASYTVKMIAGAFYEIPAPVYTGRVDGIWDAVNGNAMVTENS